MLVLAKIPLICRWRETKTVKGSKGRNHRCGPKKKDKNDPEAGDQHTVTEDEAIGAVTEDAVRADTGEGLNATQHHCLSYPEHTQQHGANPARVSTSIKLYEFNVVVGEGPDVFPIRDIMWDRPLIPLIHANAMDVPAEFAKLSPDKQALFLSLDCR